MRNLIIHLAVLLLVGGFAAAQAETCPAACAQECPVAKKVGGLLEKWEAATAQAASEAPAQRQALARKVSGLAQKCPVGSRLNTTVSTVRDVLGMAVASMKTHGKDCPLEKADATSAACAAGKEMKAARAGALQKLHQLASYTADATRAENGCGTKAATECPGAACESAAGAPVASAACPVTLASRIGALKASFVQARAEVAALSDAARSEILAGFASLGHAAPAVSLVPASVMALAEGFEALEALHGKMGAWARANPQVMSDVPAVARQSFMIENALVSEARGLLADVVKTVKAMQGVKAAGGTGGSR